MPALSAQHLHRRVNSVERQRMHALANMPIHRAADIEKQQYFCRIAPFGRNCTSIEPCWAPV